MTAAERRRILEDVRAGVISPEEGVERIEALASDAPPREAPRTEASTAEPATRVRIEGAMHAIRITGDPSVREVDVDGAHTLSREGDTIVIQGSPEAIGFELRSARQAFRRHRNIEIGIGDIKRKAALNVRMNPHLPLEVDLDAGGLSIKDVRAAIKGRVSAGGVRVEGFRSPIDLKVDAGGVTIDGLLEGGDSRIRCDAGAVKVALDPGSSVRVTARTSVGKIALPGTTTSEGGRLTSTGEAVIGGGAGTLDIAVSVGAIKVLAGDAAATA